MKGLGTLTSSFVDPNTGKPAGLTSDDHPVKISVKGVSTPSTGTNKGSCTFSGGSAIPGGNGTVSILSWAVALASPSTDCVSESPVATDEWTTYGSISIKFTDTSSMTASIAIAGFVTGTLNETDSTGIVTKGHAAGAFISNQSWFDPIVKDKTQTSQTPYPGYSYLNVLALIPCAGTVDVPVTVGAGASITSIVIGSGTDPEGLNGNTAAGLQFYTGEN